MTRTADEFWAILRASLFGASLPAEFIVEDDAALLSLARRQEMLHLLYVPLVSTRILPTLSEPVQTAITEAHLRAIQRTAQLVHEQRQITAVLDRIGVAYIPLKGAALREYWRSPWKRTSCDIDILIHPEDAARAADALSAELGYRVASLGHHDHSLYAPNGVHLELHFSLSLNLPADRVLARVWEYASPLGEGGCHQLDPAFMFVYLAAHHVSHLLAGGGGIRPVADIAFLLRAKVPNDQLMEALAAEAELTDFLLADLELGVSLIRGSTPAPTAEMLRDWLLSGGIYGDVDRRAAIRRTAKSAPARRRARRRYVISRLFPPCRTLAVSYPVLRRAPVLLPFVWCHRLLRLLFGGRLRVTLRRLRADRAAKAPTVATAAALMQALKLTPPSV